ncbi:MAG: DegQ family serine endoprotease [Alphaproteobacteria bacterium]|nr:DegQ family serine endoprotease [Alphaproteobacteria bacterium]
MTHRRSHKILLAGIVTLFCVAMTLTPVGAQAREPGTGAPESFADLTERLSPAVVNISSTQKIEEAQDYPEMPQFPPGSPFQDFFEEFMNRRGHGVPFAPPSMMGSGFVIDAQNGYIVTNNHVIQDADDIHVILQNDQSVPAEIIGKDPETDIAVLKIDPKGLNLVAAPIGDSDQIRVGDWILAIGNPYGLGGSVTAGIVSALARDINSGKYDDYIQTDASINRGNSGGPMFNMNGEVIGINTAIFSPTGGSIGIGFAIPSARAKPVISQLIKFGQTRRGWLGVKIQTVTPEIAESLGLDKPRGALVVIVNKEGPADKAGIQDGDIILSFDGQEIKEMRLLPRFVAETDIDKLVDVEYWRDNKIHKTKVQVGYLEKAEEDGMVDDDQPNTASGGTPVDTVGVEVSPVTDSLRATYNIQPSVRGLVVVGVMELSEAAEKGLVPGDVIVEVNQQPVSQPQHLIDIIEKAKGAMRSSVLLLINRGGEVSFVALKLPAPKE